MSDLDPYAVACPECGAQPEQPCVYRPLAGIDPDFVHYLSRARQQRHALTGTPTKRPHNGRISAARDRAHKRAAAARRKALEAAGRAAEASPQRRQIARLEAEFDRQEYEQLRSWLAQFAGVLID